MNSLCHSNELSNAYRTAAIFVAERAQGFMFLQKYVVFCRKYIFNAEVSPLRHIVDSSMRHYVLLALGFMWTVASLLEAGSYTLIPASIIGHVVLISAAFLIVTTYTKA